MATARRAVGVVFLFGGHAMSSDIQGAGPRDLDGYSFEQYQIEFERIYDPQDVSQRAAFFGESFRDVVRHNREYSEGKHTWYKALNQFSDWSSEEFQSMKNGKMRHVVSGFPLATTLQSSSVANPMSVDWRHMGVVTAVKNQKGCGSCWAFSATEVVESHYAISTGTLLTLAPQTYVNCVQSPDDCGGKGGCQGSTMELAFNFTAHRGIALESDVPYMGKNMPCTLFSAAVKASGYLRVPSNDAAALETAVATQGPVSVAVYANWAGYGGGIYSGGCDKETSCTIDHGVVVVGYSSDYWLVRNSWGRLWGEAGYIRLSRDLDAVVFRDTVPSEGTACKPYPSSQDVGGESGILFDASYPVGVSRADVGAAVVV